MKQLLILRHGAPEKQGPDGTDFSRRLTPHGFMEGQAQGRYMAAAGLKPDLIATSAAVRARETAEALHGELPGAPGPQTVDALYNASGDMLLEYLRGLPDHPGTVLLVGHMPGVGELLNLLVTEDQDLAANIRAGTLIGLTLPEVASWHEAAPATAVLFLFAPPLVDEG